MYNYKCTTHGCECITTKLVNYSKRETVQFDCTECGNEKTMKFEAFIPGQKNNASIVFKGRGYNEGY